MQLKGIVQIPTDIGEKKTAKPQQVATEQQHSQFQQQPSSAMSKMRAAARGRVAIRGARAVLKKNSKAKNIMATCKALLEIHDGEVPHDRAALEALPGVGRKTANVVLNTAFGEPTMAVDTHIFRVANRTGLAPGKTPLAVEKALIKRTPPEYLRHAHHWLILHGRYTCKARKPLCGKCPVIDLCNFSDKKRFMD